MDEQQIADMEQRDPGFADQMQALNALGANLQAYYESRWQS